MAASVRIEASAFSDIRFSVLAKGCQLADADHALGKMARLWRQCTDTGSCVLSEQVVAAIIDPDALCDSGLGERVEGGIRICGTAGRIEWLQKLKTNAKKGGLARAGKPSAKRQNPPTAKRQTSTPAKRQPTGKSKLCPPIPIPIPITIGDNPPISPPEGGDRSAPQKPRGPDPALVRSTSASVVEAFNRVMGRSLSAGGFEKAISKLLAKGYTEAEMRGVVWWAGTEWGDDPEMARRLGPTTLLKLQSSHGYRTFPEYLAHAGERWRETHGGSEPPWERRKQTGGTLGQGKKNVKQGSTESVLRGGS